MRYLVTVVFLAQIAMQVLVTNETFTPLKIILNHEDLVTTIIMCTVFIVFAIEGKCNDNS